MKIRKIKKAYKYAMKDLEIWDEASSEGALFWDAEYERKSKVWEKFYKSLTNNQKEIAIAKGYILFK